MAKLIANTAMVIGEGNLLFPSGFRIVLELATRFGILTLQALTSAAGRNTPQSQAPWADTEELPSAGKGQSVVQDALHVGRKRIFATYPR
jgi:hypothetical protein